MLCQGDALGTRSHWICPVSQSNSCWKSTVGTGWAEGGGGAPSCAYRDIASGMFTSAVYL